MAIVGNNGVVKIATTSSSITWTPGSGSPTGGTVIGEIRNFSVESTADTIETSTMGDDTRQYVKGMSTWSGNADVLFDGTQFNLLQPNKGGANQVGTPGVFIVFYPEGDTAGTSDQIFGGTVCITGMTVTASFDGLIEASISFQGSGPLFYQTNG